MVGEHDGTVVKNEKMAIVADPVSEAAGDAAWLEHLESQAKSKAEAEGKEYVPPEKEEDQDEEPEDKSTSDESQDTAGDSEEDAEKVPEKDGDIDTSDDEPEDFDKSMVDLYKEDLNVSEDEAKELVDREKAYAEKYKVPYNKENQKLIKANRHLQANHDRLDNKVKSFEEQAEPEIVDIPEKKWVEAINAGEVVLKGVKRSKDEVIDAYKEAHHESEDFSDDAVVLLASKLCKADYDNSSRNYLDKVKGVAKDKRTQLLDSVAEEDAEFKKEFKSILLATPDQIVARTSYDFSKVQQYVYGKAFKDLRQNAKKKESDAEKRGYDRGFSDRKIKGKKSSATSSGSGANTNETSSSKSLNDNEKAEAIYMFRDMEEQVAFEMYSDLKKKGKL